MELVFRLSDEVDISKEIYQCTNCLKVFNWSEDTYWFGSQKQLEEDKTKIKYACSTSCKNQLKLK